MGVVYRMGPKMTIITLCHNFLFLKKKNKTPWEETHDLAVGHLQTHSLP